MIVGKHRLIALAVLGFCLLPLLSCGTPGSGLQTYAQVAPQPPGTARVWFLLTRTTTDTSRATFPYGALALDPPS